MSLILRKEENLIFSYIHYPEYYGLFILFSDSKNGNKYLCECFRESANFLNSDFYLTEGGIPEEIGYLNFRKYNIHKYSLDIRNISFKGFKPNLCHICNGTVPSHSYCDQMYGSKFKQKYGWYINLFEIKFFNEFENQSQEFQTLINQANKLFTFPITNEKRKLQNKLERKINNIIENEVRKVFNFKPIGEQWLNETLISKICKDIYPDYKIITHYRPKYLEGLELDVYIEELKCGIEYQGKQHFEPIDFFGGEKSFKKVVERDKKKRLLCHNNNIKLIYVNYYEKVSVELVKEKLKNIN